MENRKFYSLYLLILIPTICLIVGLSAVFYYAERKVVIENLESAEKLRQVLKKRILEEEFQSIVSDLLILASHEEIESIANRSADKDYRALAREFELFSKHKKKYDQVRLLGLDGQELIRVNYRNGRANIVPRDQLQSKANRYYFKDTVALDRDEIFVSPFDLNVENGEIEKPYKPTIRFGMPVFSRSGEKVGVIILNYNGEFIRYHIERVPFENNTRGFGILLNNEGFYLKGIKKEAEWGFMLEHRENQKFINDFPQVSALIMDNFSGQVITDEGIFTYITVYPLVEGLKSSSGSREAFGESVKKFQAHDYYWKMISFIPREDMHGEIDVLRDYLIVLNIVLIVIICIASRYLALSAIRRKEAEALVTQLAHFDHLTGLPNRKTLYDRLGRSIAMSKREKNLFFVFFIDLDGFKSVNDNYGHEAGDKLLCEIADRLKNLVRESDTVARIGGDEFVILLNSARDAGDAGAIAKKILESLSREVSQASENYSVTASIGIAVYPTHGEGVSELLNSADSAMYKAKESGKNTYYFHQEQPSGE